MVIIFVLFLLRSVFEIDLRYKEVRKARLVLGILDGVRIWHEKVYSIDGMTRKIEKNKLPVDIVLKMIGLLIPNEIILDELSLDQAIYQLVLKGKIFAQADLTEGILTNFMQQLESSPVFVEVRLVSSQNKESSQEFEVICDLYHE